ncbi:nuclear pore-associated protein 1-like [Lutra lutra]|uniref:nuclear pore-associated protein 1-like n=1 Tax=Lutra lutra TaxID=9657 RepID=UPI001FD615C9|nr:nuclear pore-associated protein 1-like [Lutra lutra]
MGNLLCKFRPPPRRRPLPGRCRPLVSPACSASHPVRHHPAAPPAPALSHCPGHRPFHRDRRPLPASFHVEPKRRYPLPQALCSPVGLLPSVNWRHPPKKPVLSARTSMMFGPSRTVRIPPPRQKFTVLPSPPEQTVEAAKPKPSSSLPRSCPKGLGEKVQEVPREGKEDFGETRGQDDGNRAPHSSGDILLTSRPLETGGLLRSDQCSPAPGDQSPSPSGDSLGGNTQIPRVSSPSPPTERPVVTSEGPAGDVVPLRKPDTEAAVLSDPTPSCPLLQGRLTREGVAENHQPSHSTQDLSRKVREAADKPSGMPSEYSLPPVSAASRPSKRKISMPLFVPLPSAMPLQWGRGELPPPPKLPCIAIDKILGISDNTEGQGKRILEGGAEILADDGATQPAPSSPLLASKTTDSLPPAIHTSQVPVPTTDLADQSARPPIPSVPPPSPTENTDQETGHGAPNSPTLAVPPGSPPPGEIPLKNKDPLQPVINTTPTSDPPTPPNTSTVSSQLPSCKGESPSPMCVDSPTLFPPTPLPVPSPNSPGIFVVAVTTQPVSSAVTAKASANLTSGHTSNSDVTDMDTTPPSQAITFSSPPGPGVSSSSSSQGHCNRMPKHPQKALSSTIPSQLMAACPNITPQPTQGTLAGQQQTAVLPSAGVSTGLLVNPGTTTVPVGSTSANCSHCSNPDAMDTTPPSQAVVFHSLPQPKANHRPFYNTPPSSSHTTNLSARSTITRISIPILSAPGITSQPVSGNQNGQQLGNQLGKPVAPTRATGPTASIAQPSKDGRKQPGLAASAFGTTVKKQKAFGSKTGILPDGISTASARAVAAGIRSARVSGSLITLSTLAPHVSIGPAAPMDGGSFGSGVSIPGPAHSQVPGTSKLGAGLQGAPSTTPAPPFGQTTPAVPQNIMAAAAGGASTVTLNPVTWGQPVQNVGGAVVGNRNTVSTVGGAGGPSTLSVLLQVENQKPKANAPKAGVVR